MSGVLLLQIVAIPLLCFAAARDIATRLIPDGISICILAAGIVARVTVGWAEAGISLLVALGVFALLLPLAMRGLLGGGDVKLMAALAAGLSPFETWSFVVATVFAGGVLGLAYILGRYLVPETRLAPGGPLLRRVLAVEARRVRRRGPLPYAVAIAIGGTLVLLNLPGA
ncbi:A24 family peptidase [Neoroseomonas rubea]|uniref:A24 family peptidase n=1 Tax=Neoroseomonas rubea TaxID=2748666 RepID=UPI0018E01E16|nr:prepilin peptidase [Roseomonas rubea]